MRTLGSVLLGFGITFAFYALTMNTTVPVTINNPGLPTRVYNLRLMKQRQNCLVVSGLLIISGIVLLFKSKPPSPTERYAEFYELAKRAEFKGKVEEAIDHYFDTLYYFEKEFIVSSIEKQIEKEEFVARVQSKIKELKCNVTFEPMQSLKS